MLLARTSKATARLSAQFRDGHVEKIYWAIVEGRVAEDAGEWTDTLLKDEGRNIVRLVPPGTAGGLESALSFRVLGRGQRASWLEVRPISGRSHQIRVELRREGSRSSAIASTAPAATRRRRQGKGRALHARA